MTERTLYGAVTTNFPRRFRDASYTRRVPYNQEVFVDSNRDESLVFEVNELDEKVQDDKGATHFLQELRKKLYPAAQMNYMNEQEIQNCELKNGIPEVVVTTAVGKVDISRRRQGREVQSCVKIYVANMRLKDPRYKTDVIITAYEPVSNQTVRQSGPSGEMAIILKEIIENFKVTDWSFFTEDS